MHKNTHANVSTLSAIAISAILLTSFTMIGMQYSHHAMAQTNSTGAAPSANMTSPSGNATGAAPSGNASGSSSSAATSANATSAQEPPIGQSFVLTGTKSSQLSPLAGRGHGKGDQVVGILIPRTDNAVYSGVLTYSASKSPNVEIWNDFSAGNTSAIPTKTFGAMKTSTYLGKPIAIVDLSPSGGSGSVPFSGKAVLLHATSPFTVTYTINAVAQPAKVASNVSSAMALATPPAPAKLSGGSSSGGSSSGGSSSGSSSSSSSKSSKSTSLPPSTLS
jgi:hypothetical protein